LRCRPAALACKLISGRQRHQALPQIHAMIKGVPRDRYVACTDQGQAINSAHCLCWLLQIRRLAASGRRRQPAAALADVNGALSGADGSG